MARYGASGLLRLHAAGMGLMLVVAWLFLRADAKPAGQRNWPPPRALPGHRRQIYTHLATALPGLCFFCYTVMAVTLLTFIPQHAGRDRTWLAVALPLMGTGGAFCAGWLAQYWLSQLRLLRISFCGVGLAGLGVWLCSGMGTGIAPAAVPLMFMAGLAGGAAYALVPYLSGDSLLHAHANGAIAQMGNLGSTLGPPLFAALMVPLGLLGMAEIVEAVQVLATSPTYRSPGQRRQAGTGYWARLPWLCGLVSLRGADRHGISAGGAQPAGVGLQAGLKEPGGVRDSRPAQTFQSYSIGRCRLTCRVLKASSSIQSRIPFEPGLQRQSTGAKHQWPATGVAFAKYIQPFQVARMHAAFDLEGE